MIAAGDAIAERLQEKYLTELHGLATAELMQITDAELGRFPRDRIQCAGVVFEALRDALARYRSRLVEEFTGEKALICTCFGVSEDTLVAVIAANRLTDVDDVASFCRAGSGCGSCRMLIAEFIDAQSR